MSEAAPKDFQEYLTTLIKQAVQTYLAHEQRALDVEQLPIDLRLSARSSFGDYSMPVMSWAGKNKLGRPAQDIAEALAIILRTLHIPGISEITVTRPGFLNFRLNHPVIGRSIIERVM